MAEKINYTFYDRGPDDADSPPCLSSHDPDSELEDTDEKLEPILEVEWRDVKRQKLSSEA
jgi:hypothetical protein